MGLFDKYAHLKQYKNGVMHCTFNPGGPGVVRIHLIPPRFTFFGGGSYVVILNGYYVMPIGRSWALMLSRFISEVNRYDGKPMTEASEKWIIRRTLSYAKKIYPTISREELEAIWKKSAAGGGYANADRLQPGNTGLDAIVTYMAKQLWARGMKRTGKEDEIEEIARFMTRHPGKRRKWSRSHNLKLPKVRTSDSRCSNAVVKRIAQDFRNDARAEMEKVYPGYSFVRCAVYYSDVIDGVFIRCVMRRKGVGS